MPPPSPRIPTARSKGPMIPAPMAAPPGSSRAIAVKPADHSRADAVPPVRPPRPPPRLPDAAAAAGWPPPGGGVGPAVPQQLAVRALLDNAPALKHDEP